MTKVNIKSNFEMAYILINPKEYDLTNPDIYDMFEHVYIPAIDGEVYTFTTNAPITVLAIADGAIFKKFTVNNTDFPTLDNKNYFVNMETELAEIDISVEFGGSEKYKGTINALCFNDGAIYLDSNDTEQEVDITNFIKPASVNLLATENEYNVTLDYFVNNTIVGLYDVLHDKGYGVKLYQEGKPWLYALNETTPSFALFVPYTE